MSDIVIRAESLGKKYTIGHQANGERYTALRDAMKRGASGLWRKTRDLVRGRPIIQGDSTEDVWALKDVSFEISRGEAVGVIGRNGAGKSTLLKVLSRITEPSAGRVAIKGRVASLLEVGTGFHPELTGRENIYLNGAILGMTRWEIKRKFDEIVDFAEVEKFLDTPVKRYSSGMYVRLAFAVAAHLEPEILLIDEVLAVGDAEFQKKCLGKMGEVGSAGRTILFVSHNMVAAQSLCQSGFLLDSGEIAYTGSVSDAVRIYMQGIINSNSGSLENRIDRQGTGWLKFTDVTMHDHNGDQIEYVVTGQNLFVRLHYVSERQQSGANVLVAFNIRNDQCYLLANLNSYDTGQVNLTIFKSGFFECYWPKFNFRSGVFDSNVFCSVNGELVDWVQSAFTIRVEDGDFFGSGNLIQRSTGDVMISHSWTSSPATDRNRPYESDNDTR